MTKAYRKLFRPRLPRTLVPRPFPVKPAAYPVFPRLPGVSGGIAKLPPSVRQPAAREEWVTPRPTRPYTGYPVRKFSPFFADPDFPPVKFEIMNPSWEIDVDFPIEDFLGRSYSAELLKSAATEAGGNATVTLTATAGLAAEVAAFEITMQQSTFQTPQGSGRLTATLYPKTANAWNVGDRWSSDDAGPTPAVSAGTALTMSIDWSSPADGLQRRFYMVPTRRIAGLGRTVPEVAAIRTATAAAGTEIVPAALNAVFAFTNLASGSGVQFVVQACTPGTLPYERLLKVLPTVFGQA